MSSSSNTKSDFYEKRYANQTKVEHCLPSDNYKKIKTELNFLENKIALLNSEKTKLENELFKLPEKQKTLTQINKKRILDDKLTQIEKDLNNYKIRIRDLHKK